MLHPIQLIPFASLTSIGLELAKINSMSSSIITVTSPPNFNSFVHNPSFDSIKLSKVYSAIRS